MNLFDLIALVVTVTAALGYLNRRLLRLPTVIGVMVGGLTLSLALLALGSVYSFLPSQAEAVIGSIRFDSLLMNGMLSFLLFAGSLNIDASKLFEKRWTILTLATVGTLVSTALIGGTIHAVLGALGLGIPLAAALNGAKGEAIALAKRRGWDNPLEASALREQRRPRDARGDHHQSGGVAGARCRLTCGGVQLWILVRTMTLGGYTPVAGRDPLSS